MIWPAKVKSDDGKTFYTDAAAPTPSTPAPKNCQTGWADFCKASQHDGVACPSDSCDIDDGVRKDHAPSTPAPMASDQQIQEWADRHGINIHGTDLRCAFEDAASWRQA